MDTCGAAVCKDKKLGQMALQQKMLTSTIYLVGLFLSLQLYYKKLNKCRCKTHCQHKLFSATEMSIWLLQRSFLACRIAVLIDFFLLRLDRLVAYLYIHTVCFTMVIIAEVENGQCKTKNGKLLRYTNDWLMKTLLEPFFLQAYCA